MIYIKSFAKVNLYLEITGKRTDNYHFIESIFAFLRIYDEIFIEKNDRFELNSNNISIQNNIIEKTVKIMAEKYGFTPNIKISLIKNIPIAAGLGGGSSNAAALIQMLNEYYKLQISQNKMKEIALEMGADIGFFIHGRACFVSGVGDVFKDICVFEPIPVIIINPNIQLLTKAVFEKFKGNFTAKNDEKYNGDLVNFITKRKNDLTNSAIFLCNEIKEILEFCSEFGLARMSGSGATCFLVCDYNQNSEEILEKIRQKFPSYYIKKTEILYSINQ